MLKDITFPVIGVQTKQKTLALYLSAETLARGNSVISQRDCSEYFSQLRLIDSKLKKYSIIAAKKGHALEPIWKYNLLSGRKIRVEIQISEIVEDTTLSDIKTLILGVVRSDMWNGLDPRVLKNIKLEVKEAPSFEHIVKALTKII